MQEIWVHYPDVVNNELTTVVKVVRRGGLRTRVVLSNGRNDLVPSQYDTPVAVGDKVVLCPNTLGFYHPKTEAVLVSLRKMKKEGKLPDCVIDRLGRYKEML